MSKNRARTRPLSRPGWFKGTNRPHLMVPFAEGNEFVEDHMERKCRERFEELAIQRGYTFRDLARQPSKGRPAPAEAARVEALREVLADLCGLTFDFKPRHVVRGVRLSQNTVKRLLAQERRKPRKTEEPT